jgi:hypothetical protein
MSYYQTKNFFLDILRTENKSEFNQEISNVTSNVELQNLTSPIAHILLPTSLMVNLVDQVVSNNLNKINDVTSTQLPISNTSTPNISSNSSENNSSVVLDQDSHQLNGKLYNTISLACIARLEQRKS